MADPFPSIIKEPAGREFKVVTERLKKAEKSHKKSMHV